MNETTPKVGAGVLRIDTPEQRERDKAADSFHKHLEICQQCNDHPFGLCSIGDGFLRAAFAPLSQKEMGRAGR